MPFEFFGRLNFCHDCATLIIFNLFLLLTMQPPAFDRPIRLPPLPAAGALLPRPHLKLPPPSLLDVAVTIPLSPPICSNTDSQLFFDLHPSTCFLIAVPVFGEVLARPRRGRHSSVCSSHRPSLWPRPNSTVFVIITW